MTIRADKVRKLGEKYIGNLDIDTVNMLLYLKNNITVIPNLKNSIYNFEDDIVDEIIDTRLDMEETYDKESYSHVKGVLADYQTVGTMYMYYAKKLILGDAGGLGKTVEVAALINLLRMKKPDLRVLILTKKKIIGQFQREVAKFCGLYYQTCTSAAKDVGVLIPSMYEYAGVIANHELITNKEFATEMVYNFKFDLLIVDESSVFKNENTLISKQGRWIVNMCDRTIFLNATPIESNIMDFVSQLDILDNQMLESVSVIKKKYCNYEYSGMIPKFRGYKVNAGEEFSNSIAVFYLSRTRKKILGYSVEEHNDIFVEFYSATRQQRDLIKRGYDWRMVLDNPGLFDKNFEFNTVNLPKFEKLIELVNNRQDKQIFIYVWYRKAQYEIYDYLEDLGYRVGLINGETSAKQSTEIQKQVADGELDIIISNLIQGVNLGTCDTVIFYSLQTNVSKMQQIEFRIMREIFTVGKEFIVLLGWKEADMKYLETVMINRADSINNLSDTDKSIIYKCKEIIDKKREEMDNGI